MEKTNDINITQLNKGRIHLPSEFRKENNLNDGDQFILTADSNIITLIKISKDKLRRLIE